MNIDRPTEEKSSDAQSWIMDRMKAAGYSIRTEGVCNGLSFMGIQAMLVREEDLYFERLQIIARMPPEYYVDMSSQSGKWWERSKNDPDLMENWINIRATMDSIMVYQDIHVSNIEAPETIIQSSYLSSQIVMPGTLEEKISDALSPAATFSGVYNTSELENALELTRNLIREKGLLEPVCFHIGSRTHSSSIGYDPQSDRWTVFDANQNPDQLESLDNCSFDNTFNVASWIMYSQNFINNTDEIAGEKYTSFLMEVFTEDSQKEIFRKSFSALQKTPEWEQIYKVTDEKSVLQTDEKDCWWYHAIRSNEKDTLMKILHEIRINHPDEWENTFQSTLKYAIKYRYRIDNDSNSR